MSGAVQASVDVRGNREDLTGKVVVNASGVRPMKNGPVALDLVATLGDADTDVDLKVRAADSPQGEPRSECCC